MLGGRRSSSRGHIAGPGRGERRGSRSTQVDDRCDQVCGQALTSSNTRARYSPITPLASRFREPMNKTGRTMEAHPGTEIRKATVMTMTQTAIPRETRTPNAAVAVIRRRGARGKRSNRRQTKFNHFSQRILGFAREAFRTIEKHAGTWKSHQRRNSDAGGTG